MSTISGLNYQTADQTIPGVMAYQKSVSLPSVEGMVPLQSENVRIFTPSSRQGREIPGPKVKVIRRLRGFLVEVHGEEARVVLEDKGERSDYFLPCHLLHSAGISEENQPFEMDEYEAKADDESFFTGYIFRPLARAVDAFTDTFDLDERRKHKRTIIFEKFKDAAH